MSIKRRDFLKIAASTAGAALVGPSSMAHAYQAKPDSDAPPSVGILVDTTRCIGCRMCEATCNCVQELPKPEVGFSDSSVFERNRCTCSRTFTVVNRYTNPKNGKSLTVKTQCMHCNQPACASACLVRALEKTPEGPVIYHEDRCIGCRYCLVACPFNIPKFEYQKPIPAIRKCTLCYEERIKKGEPPACAHICPTGALRFGKRRELLEVAKSRIYRNPDMYVHHIYGEHEVAGTGVMYISSFPFEMIDFRMDLGRRAYPELTLDFLSAVPLVLIMWPAGLMGFHTFSKRRERIAEIEAARKKEEPPS